MVAYPILSHSIIHPHLASRTIEQLRSIGEVLLGIDEHRRRMTGRSMDRNGDGFGALRWWHFLELLVGFEEDTQERSPRLELADEERLCLFLTDETLVNEEEEEEEAPAYLVLGMRTTLTAHIGHLISSFI